MKKDNGTILVVDDDSMNRSLLAINLKEEGHVVHVAEDGEQALEMLHSTSFDVVLLDLLMPKVDGFQVLEQMKADSALQHIPVIVISAEDAMENIARCLEMGATDYLPKPFDPLLLRTRVQTSLTMKRLYDRQQSYTGRMLVVEDDPFNRALLTTSLAEKGYTVEIAEGGRQALEMLHVRMYDVVFLDLLMPDMDGFEVLQRMKAKSKLQHIPVIIVSAEDDRESIVRCIEMGATDHLTKPFDPVLLHARVNASLAAKRLHDQEQAYFKLIQAERQKSERLLLNILPKPVADRLKQGEKIIADSYSEVTVLFADIVGFTKLSAQISPTELVILLNEIFSLFDSLAEQHGLEKIKTIGDAYMVVGGLPVSRPDHAEAVAGMALEMQHSLAEFNKKHGKALHLRIGIHSGPVVAGVIGAKKFSYDLWGDTVNTASRMESHGIVDGIQVTAATYERLKDQFLFEERGAIQVKGKGEMETYLLKGYIAILRELCHCEESSTKQSRAGTTGLLRKASQ